MTLGHLPVTHRSISAPSRRGFLAALSASVALPSLTLPRVLVAQDEVETVAQSDAPKSTAFSFDVLSEKARAASAKPYVDPEIVDGFLGDLDYDAYQRINFKRDASRWSGDGQNFLLQAFHLGWLFKEPVKVYSVENGQASEMSFSADDFDYGASLVEGIPEHTVMPGVAGFRLLNPINSVTRFDELVAFLGASYFRALGRDNVYGLSARGLAVNTAMSGGEEFPRFSHFWIETPVPGARSVTVYAMLDSRSVTGAYRFVIHPGETTEMDVTCRLFLREDVEQLGIAPLTSMYLFGGADPGEFDDFRESVHDSEYLILNMRGGDTHLRALNNPPRLASSYLGAENPASFGLVQRSRAFDDYLDAQAHYERRPSLMVVPQGDWGRGSVRLVEIPSDLEGNDNIVAFWVPEGEHRAGDELEYSYRLLWGMSPEGAAAEELAHVVRTRVGEGGVAGVEAKNGRRKFVIDFQGGPLRELSAGAKVEPEVSAVRGEIAQAIVSKIDGTDTWRLVVEASVEPGSVMELRARLSGYDRTLTETWLYQWMRK